jgi:CSLREA domain-containing protein
MPSFRVVWRACRWLLVLAALAPVAPAGAQTFFVNSVLDVVDAAPGNGTCATAAGTCTLRAAIQEANRTASGDVLILVPPGVYRVTIPIPTANPCARNDATGGYMIKNYKPRRISIAGTDPGSTIVDGNALDGVFDVDGVPGSTTLLANMTIRNGNRSNTCRRFGGGVHAFSTAGSPGTVTIDNCVVTDNVAQSGGGIFNESTTMSVTRSVVRNNRSSFLHPQVSAGGGIENFSGSLTVDASTISGNKAQVPTTATSATPSDGAGGGVGVFDGPVTITNSTISGNTADGNGGGIDVTGVIAGKTLTLRNVTITGNTSDANANNSGDGGGLADDTQNVVLENSILAGNSDSGGQGVDCSMGASATLTMAIKYAAIPALQTCSTHTSPAPVGLINSFTPISALQANGGLGQTHDLVAGSPARDAGDPSGCGFATDQRKVPRPQGARCDLGAVEAGAPDTDNDRVPDVIDDCTTVVNLDQRDSDGDKVGDMCDNCPAVGNASQSTTACLTGSSNRATIDSTGGTVSAGGVTITVPPGALGGQPGCVSTTCPTSFSVTGLTTSEYQLGSGTSGGALYLSAKFHPENVTFNGPVTVTFSWPDADAMPGVIDGTSIVEIFIRIFQNGVAITGQCGAMPCGTPPCCSTSANTFSVLLNSFSELALVQDGACVPSPLGQARIELTRLKPPPTDDRMQLTGIMTLKAGATIADIANVSGIGVVLGDDVRGRIAGAQLAPGQYDPGKKRGWRQKQGGALWRYRDDTATPPGGIRRVVVRAQGVDGSGRPLAALLVRGRGVDYAADVTAQANVTLAPHDGPCFAALFPGSPGPRCRFNAARTALRCE